MRCLACNTQLNDREATRKYASTGTFIDLCNGCFAHVADEIADLESENDVADYDFSQEDVDDAIRNFGGLDSAS